MSPCPAREIAPPTILGISIIYFRSPLDEQHMLRLPPACSNRREEHRHLRMAAHILQPLHRGGRRNDQRPCIGVEVIQNHRQANGRAIGGHTRKLTHYRFLDGMIHPIRQLLHTFPSSLSTFHIAHSPCHAPLSRPPAAFHHHLSVP